jgi:hypothetical protein
MLKRTPKKAGRVERQPVAAVIDQWPGRSGFNHDLVQQVRVAALRGSSFMAYPWFRKVHRYENPAQLLADLKGRVIGR